MIRFAECHVPFAEWHAAVPVAMQHRIALDYLFVAVGLLTSYSTSLSEKYSGCSYNVIHSGKFIVAALSVCSVVGENNFYLI